MSVNPETMQHARERLERLLREDREVESAVPSREASLAIGGEGTTIETIAKAFELYAERPCLGERTAGGPYRIIRYREVWERARAFASGLRHEGLADTGASVGVCGFGGVDWVVADLACAYLAAISAPFQTGMSPTDLKAVIRQALLRCIVCSSQERAAIEAVLPDCPTVESVLVMDAKEDDARGMRAIERRGRERGLVPMVLPSARGEPDPLMTLLYTSGSTGAPKGAIVRESLFRRQWQRGFFGSLERELPDLPLIALDYMPLNHGAGRGLVMRSVVSGGTTYFVAKSDMSTLFEDLQLVRPTTMLLVPRVAAAIHERYQTELVRRSADPDALLAEMGRTLLGDRLLVLLTSTAPTPPKITAFLERCFDVPVLDAYGSTEAGPITFEHKIDPTGDLQWKLVDVPELGYRTTDQPYPRGELHVKSSFSVPGYLGDDRATRDLFDEEGYVKTGDIVEQRGPDTLVWLDRAKNVLKLAQGEFVATSRLEGIYASRSPYIRQIFLYGDSFHAYLVAVIVPNLEAALPKDDAAIKHILRAELERVAREESLRSYEVPRDFIVERTPFTVENELLTASSKQSRPRLVARYRTQLDGMYAAIERAHVEELYALRGPLTQAPPAERVRKAIAVTAGLTDIDDGDDRSFITLGGDSLSAVGLATLLRDITAVDVPVGFLLDPTSSVRGIVAFVERALRGGAKRDVTFAEVHGSAATSIRAEDVRIEALLTPDEMRAAAEARTDLPRRAEGAILSGANGFLGRFLALELASRGARVYALVRAPSDVAARERLARTYATDPRLAERFAELEPRIEVFASDLIAPRLGLSDEVYARLAEQADLVVHNGALVNHALGYEQLFEPNVLGTVRMMRLALDRRVKSFSYVSTIGVLQAVLRREPVREDEDLRALVPERALASGYAAGYGTSKWVSELLLREAHEKLGLPVAIFRPSEIMAHPELRGQVNVPDFFTRLVAGIVYTGLAPASFFAPDDVRHYDGLPVNAVARSIAAPSADRDEAAGFATYHVVNPHGDDGVSLDTIVDWIRTAGYTIERVLDYDEWLRRFHDRLESLPDAARQHSPLAILGAWSRPDRIAPAADDALLLTRLATIAPELADLPHVTEALIHKMLDDLASLGVIEPPPRPQATARRPGRAAPAGAR